MKKGRSNFVVTLEKRRWLSQDTYEVTFNKPEDFFFRSGQHVIFHMGGEERDYTMVSPENDSCLVFLVKEMKGGVVSKQLAEIPIGTELKMTGPGGYLVERPTQKQRVLVATGTGIAPFCSMIASGMNAAFLLYGVRNQESLHYNSLFEGTTLHYIKCLSAQPCMKNSSTCYDGHVTGFIKDILPVGQYEFYLCGKWDMIKDVTHVIDTRFPDANIYSEGFY
ncbi:FAD-dependent oxidoreductase [Desulfogranum marinum]|uniref:ferredoxin--NADP reductase n=1 Tax=Desulfogranum marinum TaxID=453220 RepID=UPI0029C6BB87|nr:FAD-dependent oxidoreductase [Desulfogranum marinum]